MAAKRKRRKAKAKPDAPIAVRVRNEPPIQVLKRRGALNVYELTAADEILAAHAMESGSPVARDPDLGIPAMFRPDAADDQAARRSDMIRVYRQWQAGLSGRQECAITVTVLLHEHSLRFCDDTRHWRHGTAKGHLLAGLRHFAALRGNTPRGARGWKLVA